MIPRFRFLAASKGRPLLRYLLVACLLSVFTLVIQGQEAEEESEQQRDLVDVDTCGTLGGNRVIYTVRTDVSWSGNPFHEAIDAANSIVMEIREGGETRVLELLEWKSEVHPSEIKLLKVKASRKDLRIYESDDGLLVAHFVYTGDWIRFAPAFRKRIEKGFERNDTALSWYSLMEILPAVRYLDAHAAQVVELVLLRRTIRAGYIDAALLALEEVLKSPADDTISRYGKKLLDSATAVKKALQPAALAEAGKIGKLLEAPLYPPLDSPTVFWQDKLLCVVQEDRKPATRMRTYDPRAGKWGKPVAVKYPETGMSQLDYSPNSAYMGGEVCRVCWHRQFGDPGEEACQGLTCDPLIMLNTPPGGSVENREDLKRAGGSCAAGNGLFVFGEAGLLYPMEKDTISWRLFPGDLRYGSRDYPIGLVRPYPLVVSPDQEWVAYAMEAKDGKGVDLWVGRLKYTPDLLER